jgi:hypothetical protein
MARRFSWAIYYYRAHAHLKEVTIYQQTVIPIGCMILDMAISMLA